ncbi:uncharacterized protein BDR25DRAFT_347642 [Lindgomyces ingoldianus]|uniref:Uncharacterized protein n=1 Tax=Lindgomyces ingoldianus TaxID=673940 RepID=A0ACB6Q777_9PLEO|nr:uncharacterized protein BDR25DRAFT_347642 [Lindgomyces ingoldianus]KAF2462694.1 hypothetical protein BDR25DRAFT_347642 [Lindgomyces ingoldianus]
MATTPPLSPSIAAVKTTRVEGWIQQLSEAASARANALSPPSTPESRPSPKRKRVSSAPVTSTMSTRTTSHKRPRRDTDTEVLPTHSVSAAGAASSASALILNERNTFSPPSSQAGTRSPRRANSPSRDNVTVLASASPPTITEPSSGLKTPPPRRVRDVMERLEDGLDSGWIPGWLRETIEEDRDFGYQRIERHAWDQNTASSPSDLDVGGEERERLAYVLRKVKKIWLNARLCQSRGRDENAWCMDVIRPLVKLAMRLEGKEKFWLQSVQSQVITTDLLSSVPDVSGKPRLLNRKADFTLSFSHMPFPGFEDLYNGLRTAGNPVVSHMADAFTKTTALFSCIEVKPANGDHTEAEYQLSVWIAASLRKKMQLARRVGLVDKSGLVEPCFAIVGHETHVYLAYMASEERDVVHILGPEVGSLGLCETRSVSGIFRALRLWRNVIRYGRDEGNEGFWGGFMGVVLQRLAGDIDEGHSAALTSVAQPSDEGIYIRALQ